MARHRRLWWVAGCLAVGLAAPGWSQAQVFQKFAVEVADGTMVQAAGPPRRDAHGDLLPAGAVARIGSTRLRHGSVVHAVALSPDGKLLASAADEPVIRVWDAATGRELRRLYGYQNTVRCLAWSSDGRFLVGAGADPYLRFWDPRTGGTTRMISGHQAGTLALGLSADGKRLAAAGTDRQLRIWDTATNRQLHAWALPEGEVRCLAWAPDGKTLATGGSDRAVRLWDPAAGKEVAHIDDAHAGGVAALAFARDGKLLATGGGNDRNLDPRIRLWDPATAKEVGKLPGHARGVLALAFAPDGQTLASGGWDNTVRVWDPATGRQLRAFTGHASVVSAVAFAGNGKVLASGSRDGTVRLWDPATGKDLCPVAGYRHEVGGLAFLPGGKALAVAVRDGTLHVCDPATGRELRHFSAHAGGIFGLALSPDGKTLATSGRDGTVRLWDPATGTERRRWELGSGQGWGWSVALTPDGQTVAAGSGDNLDNAKPGRVTVWDAATGRELRRFPSPQAVMGVAFAPDGKTLAWAGWGPTVHLWQVGRDDVHQIDPPTRAYRVAFSPDGKLLATGGEGAVHLWEVETGRLAHSLDNQGSTAEAVAFSPDGCTLAAATAGGPIMGSPFQRRMIMENGMMTTVTSGGQTGVRLWEVATGGNRGQFHGHEGAVRALAFAPDGRTLVSGSMDTTALVWDVTGQSFARPVVVARGGKPPAVEEHWEALAGDDAPKAYRAVWALAAAPAQALSLLRAHLQAVGSSDEARIARLVADLDSDRYTVREHAAVELEKLGKAAEPALRKVLRETSSAEVLKRAEGLLNKLTPGASTERLRTLRAVEVLEHIGTPEAKALLRMLSRGAPEAPLTRQANASLARLEKRQPATP